MDNFSEEENDFEEIEVLDNNDTSFFGIPELPNPSQGESFVSKSNDSSFDKIKFPKLQNPSQPESFVSKSNDSTDSKTEKKSKFPNPAQPESFVSRNNDSNNNSTDLKKNDDNGNNSFKDAYQKKLENGKDYYDKKITDAKNRQKDSMDKLEKNKEKQDSTKEKINKAKEKRKTSNNLGDKKSAKKEEKDEKQEEKKLKKEEKDENKKLNKAKKDEKNAKKGNLKSKAFQALHPAEAAKMFLKMKLKSIKRKIILALVAILAVICIIAIIIQQIFGPIYDVILAINEKWDSVSVDINKMNNFYEGFGYKTTKEAFYDEVDYLYEKYDEQLDIPLVLATIFYNEKDSYNESYGDLPDIGDGEVDVKALSNSIMSNLKSKYEQMYETTDEQGLNYTVGKIYRLRRLARNQMESALFNPGFFPTNPETIPISQFLEEVKEELSVEIDKLIESIPSLFVNPIDIFNISKNFYGLLQIFTGEENLDTLNFTGEEYIHRSLEILNSLIVDAYEISSIDISLTGINVTVYRYEASDENYRNYLHDYYIKNMPEFKKYIKGLEGDALENKINFIIRDIYLYAEEFDEIYGYDRDASGEDEDIECAGTIDLDIVDNLMIPVDKTSFNFSGPEKYGIVNGYKNNGVDLTASSAGIGSGDEVKSIYEGKVIEIGKNNCNTSDDSTCDPKGNFVKIKHEVKGTDQTAIVTSIYTHLSDITVKKNSKVKKGDVIGHIGSTGDAKEPTLHFELLNSSGDYMDPTNLFIECSLSSGDGLSGGTNEEKIWCYLTHNLKYPKGKAAGTMANIQAESSFISNDVQGSYLQPDPAKYNEEYTEKVDSGKISKDDFIHNGPGGGGYGLAQWTSYGRKEKLYNYVKEKKKKSIGDLESQLEFLKKEIEDKSVWSGHNPEYETWKNAKNTIDYADAATRAMMLGFERPGDQSAEAISKRQGYGREIYNKMKSVKCSSSSKMDNLKVKQSASAKEKIQAYLKWMKRIADDDSHGYSQASRNGPDYDCSSFVYYALKNTIGVDETYAYTTWTLDENVLKKYGFKRYNYNDVKNNLQPGDIVGNKEHHVTTIYSIDGGVKQIAAHSNYDGKTGDSGGKEINISDYAEGGNPYTYVFRLE